MRTRPHPRKKQHEPRRSSHAEARCFWKPPPPRRGVHGRQALFQFRGRSRDPRTTYIGSLTLGLEGAGRPATSESAAVLDGSSGSLNRVQQRPWDASSASSRRRVRPSRVQEAGCSRQALLYRRQLREQARLGLRARGTGGASGSPRRVSTSRRGRTAALRGDADSVPIRARRFDACVATGASAEGLLLRIIM